jgi:hypothetical protein
MRGTRLGASSLESETGIQPAARQDITYHCKNGHTIVVPMSMEADVPALWECRCGEFALREDLATGGLRRALQPDEGSIADQRKRVWNDGHVLPYERDRHRRKQGSLDRRQALRVLRD